MEGRVGKVVGGQGVGAKNRRQVVGSVCLGNPCLSMLWGRVGGGRVAHVWKRRVGRLLLWLRRVERQQEKIYECSHGGRRLW